MNYFETQDYERCICTLDKQEMYRLVARFTQPFDDSSNRLEMLRNAEAEILAYSAYPDLRSLNRYIQEQKRGILYKDSPYDRRLNYATLFIYQLNSASQQWQYGVPEYPFPSDSPHFFGTYDLKRGAKDLAMALLYIDRKNEIDRQINEERALHADTARQAEDFDLMVEQPHIAPAESSIRSDTQPASSDENERIPLGRTSLWKNMGRVARDIGGAITSVVLSSKRISKTSR